MRVLSFKEIDKKIVVLANRVLDDFGEVPIGRTLYGATTGGIVIAYALQRKIPELTLVDDPMDAQVVVIDRDDSGETEQRYLRDYPCCSFYVTLDGKLLSQCDTKLPWEQVKFSNT